VVDDDDVGLTLVSGALRVGVEARSDQ